jgi:hypothetical protein
MNAKMLTSAPAMKNATIIGEVSYALNIQIIPASQRQPVSVWQF